MIKRYYNVYSILVSLSEDRIEKGASNLYTRGFLETSLEISRINSIDHVTNVDDLNMSHDRKLILQRRK